MLNQPILELNSDEIQNRWKQSIRVVCTIERVFDTFTKLYDTMWEIVNSLMNVLSTVWDKIIDAWNTIKIDLDKMCYIDKIPKKRPQRFHKESYKVNTIGFKPPMCHFARSRC